MATVLPPRLVVAGTRSGVGKTTVATGLMAVLAARGTTVSGHKVGPDFVDPSFHALATGRPPRNLDTVLHDRRRIAPLLAHGAAGAEVAVIEGVMGLFDGRASGDEGSTAEVARLLDAPVLLVVDAAASSRSVAAEVHGFATFDPSVRVIGVVLNRLGSDGHEQLVRDALGPTDVPVIGALHHDERLHAPSRHLGLVPVAERAEEARRTIEVWGAAVAAAFDLDGVLRLARAASRRTTPAWDAITELTADGAHEPRSRPRIAVAGGPAFSFTYSEHHELLAAAGAEVVGFDPLRDRLPEATDALVLGGGFPEVYATELAANHHLADDVRSLVAAGGPVVAECGGLVYLCRDLDGVPMTGVLDASARFTEGLTIGYREALAATDSVLGPAATAARGHEFHRTVLTPRAGTSPAWTLTGRSRTEPEGFVQGSVHASYLHASWVGTPSLPASLVAATLDREAADGPAR